MRAMSDSPFSRSAVARLVPWIVPGAGFALVAAAVWSYARTEVVEAGGGSPYYDSAVKQALTGLRNVGSGGVDVPAGRPPLPAGLDPAEYYWCEQCKTYHQREPGAAPGAPPAAQPAPAVDPSAPPALLQRPAGGDPAAPVQHAIPPLPDGLDPANYYWDAASRSYRLRQGTGQ